MSDAMSPKRALTIAIRQVIDEDIAQGYHLPDPPVHLAAESLRLATRIHEHLPAGWDLVDAKTLQEELDHIAKSLDSTQEMLDFLLAFRLMRDGHALNLGEARKIAKDRDAVRALYPPLPGDD